MRGRRLHFAFCLLLLSRRAPAAVSSWDETQLRWLRQYSTPLRWDNVERYPDWVSGPRPQRDGRLHVIRLRPAEEILLRGSANTWLRLVGKGNALVPDDMEISLSTDGRAFVETVPISTVDHGSLLVALPQDKPALIRLVRPSGCKAPLAFAAFFSREEPFSILAPYRARVGLTGTSTRLRRDDEAASEPARLVEAGQSLDISVHGPTRLQMVVRLEWPTTETWHEESCAVEVQLDDAIPVPLLLTPELDDRHRTHVNHSIKLVSNRRYGFFDVPEGTHRLRLQPTARIYLSVFRQPQRDFLAPWLNAPAARGNQVLQPFFATAPPASLFDSPGDFLADADFVLRQPDAFRLAVNNHPLDAGAQAADWLDRIAQTRRDYPPARTTSETLWRQRTVYREVSPMDLPAGQPLRQALFFPNRLLDLFVPQWPVAVFNPTLEQVCGSLVQGGFAPVTPSASTGLTYALPLRSYDSVLRIAAFANGTARTRFFVQFDQEIPFWIALDPAPAVSANELEPSSAFATLRVIERAPEVPANFASGLPVDEFDLALPMLSPGIVELPLPQRVHRIRIYAESEAPPIIASVACRAAKPLALGESGFLALLDRCGTTAAFQMLSNAHTNTPAVLEPQSSLHNQYLPLIRLLGTHSNDFVKSIELSGPSPSNSPTIPPGSVANLTASAERFEATGDLIDALGVWNRLFWSTSTSGQTPFTLAIMRNLQSLGEEYLAQQYARVALLNSPKGQLPSEALALLEKSARQAGDAEELEQVRTFAFLRCPCPSHLAGVAEALALNSCDEMALACGLLLPPAQRPSESLLAAALHLNWWQTFDRLVGELPDDSAKEFWRAQKHLAFFHFDEAEKHLKQAGARGAEALQALRQGRLIRTRLCADSLAERFRALLAWEEWLSRQPGPRIWQAAPELVAECSGNEALFNCELNDVISFFRADPGRPLKLRFLGPVSLQIEARPILDVPFQQPVDDWIEIVEYGLTNRVAISQCIPNPSLQFTRCTNGLVSIKGLAALDWGPGWHEVELSLRDHAGLFRVLRAQPVLPLKILPALSPERMEFVLRQGSKSVSARKARLDALQSPHEQAGQPNRMLRREAEAWWVSPAGARQTPRSNTPAALETEALTQVQNLRLALRVPLEAGQVPDFLARDLDVLPLNEQWLAACRWKRWSDFTAWAALPDMDLANYHLATGRVREALDSNSPQAPLQRLMTLLQISELFPPWREEAQCLAELLAAQTNCPPGFKKILVRITQKRAWDPLAIRPVSAGIQPVKVPSDWPQDPALRIRRALLPVAATNLFTIADQSVCSAAMLLQHPAEVRVGLELARAGFSPLAPLTVSLQIDGFQPRRIPLTLLLPAVGTNLTLPAGQHLVRMWVEDPVVNQCVRISFSGTAGETTNTIWSQSFADMASEKRFFFGATENEPVRFSWTGPALLRVDEWHKGALLSQYRFIPVGEHEIALTPLPDRTQSWFQVFVRSTQTNQPDVRSAWSTREPNRVPPPQLVLPEATALPPAHLNDYYCLGGQEDGTWTATALLAHRFPFEPGGKQFNPLNEFFQGSAAYRKASPSETLWFDTEAFGRVHRQGDVTLGLSEYIEGHPQVLPFEWAWSGDAYLGWVDPRQSETESSLYTALEIGQRRHLSPKLDWYPFARLFARHLSLSPTQAKTLTYLDQDLYTTYRHNHLWGGVLGNELEYKPWLDTALKANIQVTGNEDFSADHWGMVFSWDQLFGPFRAEVAYLFTQWLADAHRNTASSLQGMSAGVYGELWLNGCNRLEIGGQYRHDWPASGDSYFLVVSWDFSQGRGYRDYSPHKSKFVDLRSRRIPAAFNNSFQPDLPLSNDP